MKAFRIKYPLLLAFGFLLIFFGIQFVIASSDNFKIKFAALVAYQNPQKENISKYFEEVNKLIYKYHKQINVQEEFEVSDFYLAIKYLNKISEIEKSFVPSIFSAKENQVVKPIEFKYEQNYDSEFPLSYSYVQKGLRGADIENNLEVKYSDKETTFTKVATLEKIYQAPISETVYFGQKDTQSFINEVKSKFDNLIKEDSSFVDLKYPTDKSKLENIKLNSILLNESKNEILNLSESFTFGQLNITLGNCNKNRTLYLNYDPTNKDFEFDSQQAFLDSLCIKQFTQMNGYLLGTCTDCLLYPIDKTHAITSDYAPEVVAIDFAPGAQRINKLALEDFREMYKAAKAAGVNLMVTSGYRSYSDQQATFNYWTSVEMAKGYSRSYAESIANTYSARPGFSEHQLGTALDLNGAGCDSFNGVCTGNQAAWDWLATNAYRFGFALSYPESKQSQTGYIFEPWHYRWIGKDLSAEFKKVEKDTYLQAWLYELGRY